MAFQPATGMETAFNLGCAMRPRSCDLPPGVADMLHKARVMAQTGVNYSMVVTAPNYAMMAIAYLLTAGGSVALEIPLTNQAAGEIIGWGTGQGAAGVHATEQLAQNLTKEAVQEMIKKGLNKATVEGLKNQYARAAAEGVKLAANPQQLPARLALMNKILELWPK